MEPVSLIVGALAAGALKGVSESASQAVKDTYARLRAAVSERLGGRRTGELVLAEHAQDPDTYAKPLAKELTAAGADTDPRILELARQLSELLDPHGARAGKYQLDLRGAQGVQVGDNNTQTNNF